MIQVHNHELWFKDINIHPGVRFKHINAHPRARFNLLINP